MCGPAAVAGIAASGAILNAYQAQQQAHAEQRYENLLYGQRREEALDAFASLQEREYQEREAAAADIQALTRRARQASSAAHLQALEAGVGGRTVQVLLNQFEADRLAGIGATERNLEFTSRQLQAQARSAARIQPPRRHLGPFDSPLGIATTLLGAGSAGAGAYGTAGSF